MNTKEAIEFVRLTRLESGLISEGKDYDDIITLLRQGEKYKQMWEVLKDKYCFLRNDHRRTNEIVYLKGILKDLEQKYFPKE